MVKAAILKFKIVCLAAWARAQQKRGPVLITKRGVAVAETKPPPRIETGAWRGSMAGSAENIGDSVAPAEPEEAWEALR